MFWMQSLMALLCVWNVADGLLFGRPFEAACWLAAAFLFAASATAMATLAAAFEAEPV
jgi:hypothetical protein